jgi:hypothetical protein
MTSQNTQQILGTIRRGRYTVIRDGVDRDGHPRYYILGKRGARYGMDRNGHHTTDLYPFNARRPASCPFQGMGFIEDLEAGTLTATDGSGVVRIS